MKYNLPKEYLSYSSFDLWNRDKDAFRRRYYENEKPFETAETIFGKTVHEELSPDGETSIRINLNEDLVLLGYLDSFNEEDLAIVDYKTGHLNSKGKAPWDKVRVQKHKQLVFYSLLVLLKHGKFNPVVQLKWLETKFKNKLMAFDGHVLHTESRELMLTGFEQTFTRKIFKWEIEKLKKEIISSAQAISKDYTLWQKRKSLPSHKTI